MVTAPSLLWVWANARLANHVADGDSHLISAFVGFTIVVVLAVKSFRQIRRFGERDFNWDTHAPRIFPVFATIFILEVITQFLWSFSGVSQGVGNLLNFDGIYLDNGYFYYYLTLQEVAKVFVLLLTLPLALRLLRAYFDFLNGWIAAWLHIVQGGPVAQAAGASEQSEPSVFVSFEGTAEAAITRAELKGYTGVAGMILSVAISMVGFIYVFQNSATTRATQIITSIETTPIAFSGTFFDTAKDLEELSRRLLGVANQQGGIDLPVVVIEENGTPTRPRFTTSSGEEQRVDRYLQNLITDLQKVGDIEGTLTAEGEAFLAKLSDLRQEIADTSRTNWDTILLRTAIIVMALVAVKIFHSVMMAAARERHEWENKLAAMRALRDGSLGSEQIDRFLALQRAGVAEAVAPNKSDFPFDTDVLVEKLADLLKAK